MPQHRIKLAHTIEFKIRTVEDFLSSSETRVSFCEGRAFSRSALQYYEHHLDEMKLAVQDKKRAKKLTVGGSGRVSPSAYVEDELCGWIKDERPEERPVSIDCIIAQCASLLPDFIDGKTDSAKRSWCAKFMRRNGLTIRRISHSGFKKHPELLALRDAFACEVTTVLMDDFLDAAS
ncbi:unnamed protein product [Phytophthora fragariaefolia]|uniref:Unnamed protein product n=1 Tax=Phytophthora fragariaefolia TaxID=1490495 RepID=A0A9W6YRZ5_9STRA|nr:unnamed protein product [Phytophthora fragariaefolia]